MFEWPVQVQGQVRDALTAEIALFAVEGSWSALLAVLPFGAVLGAAHALTPGHSKSVLATYVIGSGGSARRAFGAAAALSFTHILTAVVIALAAGWLVSRTMTNAGQSPALEVVSRVLLLAAGAWLVVRSFRAGIDSHGGSLAVGIAAGLVPYPLTLILMFYSMSIAAPETGLAFAGAMFLGLGSVLAAVALASLLARRLANNVLEGRLAVAHRASQIVEVLAGLALMAIAFSELIGR